MGTRAILLQEVDQVFCPTSKLAPTGSDVPCHQQLAGSKAPHFEQQLCIQTSSSASVNTWYRISADPIDSLIATVALIGYDALPSFSWNNNYRAQAWIGLINCI